MARQTSKKQPSPADIVALVQAWCSTNESFGLLPSGACGWTSGGCALLAFAFKEIFPASRIWGLWGYSCPADEACAVEGMVRSDVVLQHLVIQYEGMFFDGLTRFGSSAEEMAQDYAMEEGLVVTGWKVVGREDVDQDEIPFSPESLARVTQTLRIKLSPRKTPKLSPRQALCLSGLPGEGAFAERGGGARSTYVALERMGLVKSRYNPIGSRFSYARVLIT